MGDLTDLLQYRKEIAARFIKGLGLEIGALHEPLIVPDNTIVKYVDRLSVPELRTHYPELAAKKLVDVNFIDDGEVLSTIPDNSQDFIISNHMIEHCKNPIGTIENHLKKIKPGGVLYYAIPDKTYTFDKGRLLTQYGHLLEDYYEDHDQMPHYIEWAKHVNKLNEPETQVQAKLLYDMNYSIHFHCWNAETMLYFIIKTKEFLKEIFTIELYTVNEIEIIFVLKRKT